MLKRFYNLTCQTCYPHPNQLQNYVIVIYYFIFSELPGGVLVEFLVGFKNKGAQDFVLETLDASFRYPMDFNFYIQNFSTLAYERNVSPGQEATLFYSFMPAEAFAGRPFGLSVNLRYRDLVCYYIIKC